jgi:hypothetical protein
MGNPVQYNGGVPDPQNELVTLQRSITNVWFKFLVALQAGINGPGYPTRRDFGTGATSPLIGTVNNRGVLIVSSGTVEFSRDKGMTWWQAYYQGPIPAQVSGEVTTPDTVTDSAGNQSTVYHTSGFTANGTAQQTGGGALPLRAGDQFRVTWTGAQPQISYFRDL